MNDAEAQAALKEMLQSMNSKYQDEVCQLFALASVKQSSEQKTRVA
jgi:hypothetical protein